MKGMHTYKKTLWLALGILCLFVIFPEQTYAAGTEFRSVFPEGTEKVISDVVSKIITFLNIMTWLMFALLNILLDPNFIFDLDGGNFMDMLNDIWQLSRNLMNMFFALAFVAAAVYTVVTQNKELVQSNLKKFILAVVLVNLSWFLPRVLIDVSNIATSTIYNIPNMITASGKELKCEVKVSAKDKNDADCRLIKDDTGQLTYMCPCRAIVDLDMLVDKKRLEELQADAAKSAGWSCPGSNLLCIKMEKLDMAKMSAQSAVLNGMIVNHAQLGTLAQVPSAIDAGGVKDVVIFLIRELIILTIHVALFFPLLALVMAFAIRIPVLWLTMAFMPFAFLSQVGGDKLGFLSEPAKKIFDHFLKATFLPAMVAVPFSIGFVMISAGSQIDGSQTGLGAINVRLLDGIGNLWQLLWLVLSLGIIWVGVFAVLAKDEWLGKGSGAVKSFGQTLGRIAVKAPLSIPFLPGGFTPLGLKNVPRMIEAGMNDPKGGWLKDITPQAAATVASRDTAAAKIAPDTTLMSTLHKDLKELGAKLAPAQTKESRDALVKEFNDKSEYKGLNVTVDKFKEDAKKIFEAIDTAADTAKTKTKFDEPALKAQRAEIQSLKIEPATTL